MRGLNLFKFADDLQARLEVLIDSLAETLRERQKAGILSAEETTELAGITELDRIFTLMDARIVIGKFLQKALLS